MSENLKENKLKENHKEYKGRKYNNRDHKPGDNNTKKPAARQKNFRYRQQRPNTKRYDKKEETVSAELPAVQQTKEAVKSVSRNNTCKTLQQRGNARRYDERKASSRCIEITLLRSAQ